MSDKPYFRSSYRFLNPSPLTPTPLDLHPSLELDESDIYSPNNLPPTMSESSSPVRSSSSSQRSVVASRRSELAQTHPSSLPLDVPDWSKILKGEYSKSGGGSYNGYHDDDEEWERFEGDNECGNTRRRVTPPHEFLARQSAKSTGVARSVHEGVGRTLKGRDLSRVRNAIWEKTGFQD